MRQAILAFDDGRETPDMLGAGGRHDALFSQMCPQRVYWLRALANRKITDR